MDIGLDARELSVRRILLSISSSLLVLIFLPVLVDGSEVPPGYNRNVRPDPEGGPTSVQVGVFMIDLIEINDIRQSFTASLYFDVSYQDPRLADPSSPTVRYFGLEEIWWPDLGLVNRRDLDFLFPHDSEWIDWGM